MISTTTMAPLLLWLLAAGDGTGVAASPSGPGERTVCHPIEIFTRDDSRQCRLAEEFLETLAGRRTDVRITRRDVVKDPAANRRLHELCRQRRIETVGVPGIFVANQLFVGYKDAGTTGKRVEELLTIEVFTREGCPHCAKAKEFLVELKGRYPGLRTTVYDVVKNRAALDRMHELARRHQVQVPSLPMFWIYGRVTVGFNSAESTGRELEKIVAGATMLCPADSRAPAAANSGSPLPELKSSTSKNEMGLFGGLWSSWYAGTQPALVSFFADPAEPQEVVPDEVPEAVDQPEGEVHEPAERDDLLPKPPDEVHVPFFGTLRVSSLGMPAFTFLIGLVDGFNPCAMWVLIFLLSVLVNLKDRRKIVVIAGTFVAVSGLAYFSFMAAWLNVFVLIGFARWAQIGLGLLATAIGAVNVKDFYAFGRGVSLSIPESAKPGIYARVREIVSAKYLTAALIGAVVLAVLVNTIELLCTAGLPALYTQILTFRQYPWWKNYLYLGLYNVAYMFDDTIMLVIAVVTLSHRKLQQREGRWLKLFSGLVILGLGLLMLFKPEWLA